MSLSPLTRSFVAVFFVTGLLSLPPPISSGTDIAWTKDVVISDNQAYYGDRITLYGNLTINGTLTLNGTELRMNCTKNGSNSIRVLSGGTFNVLGGSSIRSTDPFAHYLFRVDPGASMTMNGSELRDCGWGNDYSTNPVEEHGLCIGSDAVRITNSTLTANDVGILVVDGSSPLIYHNNISDNDLSGVEVYNSSSPVIDHNLVCGNLRYALSFDCGGIMSESSSPIITNNTINANIDQYLAESTVGITLLYSNATVMCNEIADNLGGYWWKSGGIYARGGEARIHRNNISGNTNGITIQGTYASIGNNIIVDNFMPGYDDYIGRGIYDGGSTSSANNLLSGNSVGVMLVDSSASSFDNDTITKNRMAGVSTNTVIRGYDVTMTNCSFSDNPADLLLVPYNSVNSPKSNLTLVNPDYDPLKVDVRDPGTVLKVYWYLTVGVVWENGTLPAAGAKVNITNCLEAVAARTTADQDGRTEPIILEESTNNGGVISKKIPYAISAESARWKSLLPGVNLTSSRNVTVVLDDRPPILKILSPADGTYVNTTAILLEGITEPGAVLSLNGVGQVVRADGNWSVLATLDEGRNELVVKANDEMNNTALERLTVFRDTATPGLTVSRPRNGFLVNRTAILVEGKSTEPSANTTLNGLPVSVLEDGTFKATYNLTEGHNELLLESRDAAQNYVCVTIIGELDTVPPRLSISEPQNGLLTNRANVTVKGAIEAGAILTVNNITVQTYYEYIDWDAPLEEGANVFVLVARDRAGNTNTSSLTVIRDSTPPPIFVISPVEGAVLNDTLVELRGITEAGAAILVDHQPVALDGTAFCVTLQYPRDGSYIIVVEAFDALNNKASRSISISIDTVAPVLFMEVPVDETLTNSTTISVVGRTEPGARLEIAGQRIIPDDTGAFSAKVSLTEGANLITVNASDRAGNTARLSLMVTCDTMVRYAIASPEDWAEVMGRDITITGWTEADTIVTVIGGLSIRSNGTFSIDVELAPGPNPITITFRDLAGNNATVTLNVVRVKEQVVTVTNGPGPILTVAWVLAGAVVAMLAVAAIWLRKKR